MPAAAILGSGALSAGAGLLGASEQSSAAKYAANLQYMAAQQANALTQHMFDKEQANLAPFVQAGQGTVNPLSAIANQPGPTPPQPMTQANLEATPGYQFNLTQGLKAVTNSTAARGLGSSGAALKGAAGYATGLADSTYQNQFANAQTLYSDAVQNQNNAYNRLFGVAGIGENAAAQVGTAGLNAAGTMGNNVMGAANAAGAAGIGAATASANALTNAAGQIGGGASTYALLNALQNGGVMNSNFMGGNGWNPLATTA